MVINTSLLRWSDILLDFRQSFLESSTALYVRPRIVTLKSLSFMTSRAHSGKTTLDYAEGFKKRQSFGLLKSITFQQASNPYRPLKSFVTAKTGIFLFQWIVTYFDRVLYLRYLRYYSRSETNLFYIFLEIVSEMQLLSQKVL